MPPLPRTPRVRQVIAPELIEKRAKLQENLAEATAALERAKAIADEIGDRFDFLERTYHPKQQKVVEGAWDHERSHHSEWES
jgi:hypothetical protein